MTAAGSADGQRRRCVGIIGLLLGHRYIAKTFDMVYGPRDFCQRCGMPAGGWSR